ncbi:PREDICTED: putative transferase CAF17 homolog, mitochondrial isoform X2 [Priapulus caudatus]|nr:PREDICTED: putative transferase CAF17 homolog, mitochondrial isoform X2 [Priapulus caudatus]XP_014676495.1 PREDICTED: putative transferase CAF17 homolog, mitochondrial isoform X2 [Priapulus caudatus]
MTLHIVTRLVRCSRQRGSLVGAFSFPFCERQIPLPVTALLSYRHNSQDSSAQSDAGFISQCVEKRGLLRVVGPDAKALLQGLITNDMDCLNVDICPTINNCLYSLILNNQGRVLWDIIIYRLGEDKDKGQNYLLETDKDQVDDVLKHLKKYKLRKKADLFSMSDEMSVWAVASPPNESVTVASNKSHIFLNMDPRAPDLGYRLILASGTQASDVVTNCKVADDPQWYEKLRYRLGVGEGVVNHPPGKCFPLEANADYLNGVSFRKGCYIGQELTARTQHTGAVRKRLMPLTLAENLDEQPEGDAAVANSAGKQVGKLRGVICSLGLALMRIDASEDTSLHIKTSTGRKVGVTASQPSWWNTEGP